MNILPPETQILLVTFGYLQSEMQGPPFAVSPNEVDILFHKHAEISQLAQFDVLAQNRLPIGAHEACKIGLIDDCSALNQTGFLEKVVLIAETLASNANYPTLLQQKNRQREADEQQKPLQSYRDEELHHMQLNFYGFDPSYHVACYHFVHKIPHA